MQKKILKIFSCGLVGLCAQVEGSSQYDLCSVMLHSCKLPQLYHTANLASNCIISDMMIKLWSKEWYYMWV